MPVSRTSRPADDLDRLQAYLFHGTALTTRGAQALGDCPSCGREQKFSVEVCTGLYRCFVCGAAGNPLLFIRSLYEQAASAIQATTATGIAPVGTGAGGRVAAGQGGPDAAGAIVGDPVAFLAAVAQDRRLLSPATVAAWGVAPAADGAWLVPGYAPDGRLDQVYRRCRVQDKRGWVWRLLPTPGVWPEGRVHALHLPAADYDPARPNVVVCYSDDTEILTKRGWTEFRYLLEGDEVAAWGMDGEIRYEVPRARQVFDYSGEMVRIKSDWCDLLVTPDHRVPCKYGGAKSGRIRIASKMRRNLQMPVCGSIDEPCADHPSAAEARLLTAFVADGCVRRGHQIEFGLCKERKKERLEELLAAVGVPFEVASWGYYLIDRRNAPFLMRWCPDKSWTEEALKWPLAIRQTILNELEHWDGMSSENSTSYFTSKDHEADIISRMAVTSGWSSQVRHEPGRKEHHSEEYIVSMIPKMWRVFTSDPTREQYSGKVYCVTTSTGFVVVRRHGKALVSGNCEGPWDGMALWEIWNRGPGHNTNIIAVPGCNVWRDEWTQMCRGKCVTLMYDSDHPRGPTAGGRVFRAGYDGMVRVARRLSGVAALVRWLRWGPDGYAPDLPSGHDVRDLLSDDGNADESERSYLLAELLGKVEDAPAEWFLPVASSNGQVRHTGSVEARDCSTWAVCEGAWREAMRWRQEMGDAMAVLLAVCASTQQAGNQLFLDLIGNPGSAKTTMCRGLLVSGHCIHLENATKLMSGWQKPDDRGKDCSFLARANGKTWITCEFDVLVSSPQYNEIMGKVRRIFDGETSATYGNSDEDRVYTALRTPWIRAGTHRMVDQDQSQLGDRFMRFIIDDPDNIERREIARSALRSERAAMVEVTNCTAGSTVDSKTRLAHALTGGYVDWLRANVEGLLSQVEVSTAAEDYCIDLAELSADLRARPSDDGRRRRGQVSSEPHEGKELPTRLARQYIRLASCLAVVLNRQAVDADVLRIVRKVAMDTAAGHPRNIVQWLCSPNPKAGYRLYQETGGIAQKSLAIWCCTTPERTAQYLSFLEKIGVLERRRVQSWEAWVLTQRVYDLYLRVVRG